MLSHSSHRLKRVFHRFDTTASLFSAYLTDFQMQPGGGVESQPICWSKMQSSGSQWSFHVCAVSTPSLHAYWTDSLYMWKNIIWEGRWCVTATRSNGKGLFDRFAWYGAHIFCTWADGVYIVSRSKDKNLRSHWNFMCSVVKNMIRN